MDESESWLPLTNQRFFCFHFLLLSLASHLASPLPSLSTPPLPALFVQSFAFPS